MIFREPSRADRPSVVRIGRVAFAHLGEYRHAMGEWLDNPGVATRVAVIDDRVAGFVMVAVLDDPRGRHGYVIAIGVDDEQRRRGIGRQLLDRGLELLSAERERLGIAQVRATVAEDNAPAQALFGDAGFTLLEGSTTVYQGGQTALTLARPIP